MTLLACLCGGVSFFDQLESLMIYLLGDSDTHTHTDGWGGGGGIEMGRDRDNTLVDYVRH